MQPAWKPCPVGIKIKGPGNIRRSSEYLEVLSHLLFGDPKRCLRMLESSELIELKPLGWFQLHLRGSMKARMNQ